MNNSSEENDSNPNEPNGNPDEGSQFPQPAYNPFPEGAPPHGYPPGHPAAYPQGQPAGRTGNQPEHSPSNNPQPGHPSYPQNYGGDPYASPQSQPIVESGSGHIVDPGKGKSVTALTIASWLAVIAATTFMFGSTAYEQLNPIETVGDASSADLMQINMQAKMMLGQQALAGQTPVLPAELNLGPPEARYCYAILVGEFDSSENAIEQLDEIDELVEDLNYELTDDQKRLRRIVGELIDGHAGGDPDGSFLAVEDRDFLTGKLGYCGRLALHPADSPDSAARSQLVSESTFALMFMAGVMLAGFAAMVAGLILAITFFVRVASGSLRPRIVVPRSNGGVYIETFAIWMFTFVGGQILVGALLADVLTEVTMMFAVAAVFFGSLIVLVWPVIRGIPFSQVCDDIGWKIGNPFLEAALGGISYLAMLPAMAFGLFLAIVIMAIMSAATMGSGNELSSAGPQGHPIQEQIAAGNPMLFLGVFLTACIAAPIVEETMFRGVLYRHMRESSWKWGKGMSVLVSALFSSLIFAAIHPQGMFGIPILTTLAIGFSLVREWRDSLIGPMVMHFLNNSLVTCLLFAIM